MPYGLTNEQLAAIKTIIASYPEIQKAVLFSSCATASYQATTDINFAISGDNLPADLSAKLKAQLKQETNIAVVDVIDYEQITSKKLLQYIDACGVVVCQQGNSEWVECKLADIAIISTKTWKPGDSKEKYIGLEHIIENRLRIDHIGCSTTVSSNKYIFNNGQILFGKLRPYFRKIIKPKFSGICSTDIWVINSKKVADATFLFYFLANQEFIDISYASSGGTRMPRANWKFLAQTKWMIPPLPEQQAIAEVLSSLDDKIDLLHRQNKTLEDMAQTLFRQWFIEEAQDDWEEVPLSFFGNIICGKTPSKKNSKFYNGKIPFIKIPDMHGKTFIFHTCDSLTEQGKNSQIKKTIPSNSICVSCIATVGLVSLTSKESHTNQQINSIVPFNKIYRYYIYLYMKNSYDLLISMASGGTTTHNLNTGNFSKIKILKPDDFILNKFYNIIMHKFKKIYSNQTQIQTLENLRDTLLPKLISAEVRVKY